MEAGPRRERKVVTVLFADLVGFTARAEELDPEDVEAILRPYHERLRMELERFGGTVEKFIGDAVMALFGAPAAHEDDPERAVRAALAIRGWAREQESVQVRIAVNTGEALINLGARPESGQGMASGDVVNTTARLQSAAPVNGILVGESTFRATRNVIDYEEAEPVEAKGKAQAVRVWELIEARARVSTEAVGRSAALVGRDREIALLRETLIRVRDEPSPQLVTLVGVPGIGKSRLVRELFEVVEQGGVLTFWRQGRSLSYGEGVTFWALSEIVKAQAGILDTDGTDEARAKLRSAVDTLISDEAEAAALEQQLGPLVGLAVERELPGDSQKEAFAAWRRFFEAMAEQHSLVLVFEDLHWADDGLLDFVDHLVEWAGRLPMLIVCTARPELLERRPGWGGGKLNATTLSLSPLSDEDTARLFAALLGKPVLEAEQQQVLLSRAGGNPLYAEQFAHMVSEGADPAGAHVPENVQGIIAARLDRLPAAEKSLLQAAAVFGKVFWRGGLADGRARDEIERLLHSLERKSFVQRARRTSVSDEPEYAFLHGLVRDVAYGQIPRADRAEKHRRAAEWIESLGRLDDHAEMLAYHYRSALELGRAAGIETPELDVRALAALRAAGDRANALNAFAAAARYFREALGLADAQDPERPELLFLLGQALHLAGEDQARKVLAEARDGLIARGDRRRAAEAEVLLAEASWYRGEHDASRQHMDHAYELIEDAPPSATKAQVLSEVSRYRMVASDNGPAITIGREALEMAEQLGLRELQAHALNNIGSARMSDGDAGGIDDLETSIAIAREIKSPEIGRGYNNLANKIAHSGDLHRSRPIDDEALRAAKQFGLGHMVRFARGMEIANDLYTGRWDECVAKADAFIAECEAVTPQYHEAPVRCARASVRIARDDVDGARLDTELALLRAAQAKDNQILLPAVAFATRLEVELGRLAAAEANARDWLAAYEEASTRRPPFVDIAWVAESLSSRGEIEAAVAAARPTPWVSACRAVLESDFPRAAALFGEIGCVLDQAYAQLRAAHAFAAHGDGAEATHHRGRATEFYRSVGAKRYLRQMEAAVPISA